jgi:hypothetical protein
VKRHVHELGHRVANGFGFRRHVLGTAEVDLPGAVALSEQSTDSRKRNPQ